jgi:hypothetical protein
MDVQIHSILSFTLSTLSLLYGNIMQRSLHYMTYFFFSIAIRTHVDGIQLSFLWLSGCMDHKEAQGQESKKH